MKDPSPVRWKHTRQNKNIQTARWGLSLDCYFNLPRGYSMLWALLYDDYLYTDVDEMPPSQLSLADCLLDRTWFHPFQYLNQDASLVDNYPLLNLIFFLLNASKQWHPIMNDVVTTNPCCDNLNIPVHLQYRNLDIVEYGHSTCRSSRNTTSDNFDFPYCRALLETWISILTAWTSNADPTASVSPEWLKLDSVCSPLKIRWRCWNKYVRRTTLLVHL